MPARIEIYCLFLVKNSHFRKTYQFFTKNSKFIEKLFTIFENNGDMDAVSEIQWQKEYKIIFPIKKCPAESSSFENFQDSWEKI